MRHEFSQEREQMVERFIAARGIRQQAVLNAMKAVPREAFVPAELHDLAFDDAPLPIGYEQTISQPYIVAVMIEALELGPTDRVLEVGTGSGYAAAVLSELAAEVHTIERHDELARSAAQRLRDLGYDNVYVHIGDGTRGWPAHAPYDAIVVAAGGPDVPHSLLDQLAPGGRLVMPVGVTPSLQTLLRVQRLPDGTFRGERLSDVRFVPLVGAEGWQPGELAMEEQLEELEHPDAALHATGDDPRPMAGPENQPHDSAAAHG